jgi:hypothetical protein
MNSEGMERFLCIPVKIFGKYYLKKFEGSELERVWNSVFIEYDQPITTDEELSAYIRDIGRPLFDLKGLQWRVFLVKNFKDTSVLIFKMNHFLCDGIGALLLAASL